MRFRRAAAHPIVLIFVGVAAAIGVYTTTFRPNLAPKNFGVVDEGRVYRSGQLTPSAMRMVTDRYHIKTVIDLGSYYAAPGPHLDDQRGDRRNQRVADSLHQTRFVMPLYGDGKGNINWYVHALRLMTDPARQPILVHCGAGSERTGVAIALYENLAHGTPLEDALKDTVKYRHDPHKTPQVEETVRTWGPAIIKAVRDGTQIDDPAFSLIPDPAPAPPVQPAAK